jgi:hypothetical protein
LEISSLAKFLALQFVSEFSQVAAFDNAKREAIEKPSGLGWQ